MARNVGWQTALVVVCGVVVLAGAGCLSLSDDSVEDEVRDRLDDAEPPEEVVATQETRADIDDETTSTQQDIWYHADGRSRVVTTDEGTEAVNRTITVNDGEQLWTYFPEENRVRVIPVEEIGNNGTVGMQQFYALHERLLHEMEISDANETVVDGRDAYRVVFEPKDDGSAGDDSDGVTVFDAVANPFVGLGDDEEETDESEAGGRVPNRAEIWFDTEYMFPLRYEIETEDAVVELRFRDVAFNPGIPEQRFTFEPPANATVEEVDLPDTQEYDDVEAASEAAPFEISEPSVVPEGYEFDGVTVTTFEDENRTNAALSYRAGGREFVFVQVTDGEFEAEVDGEPVDVGGTTGTYSSDDGLGGKRLSWECNGLQYAVAGGEDLGRETFIEMARSIGC